MFKNNMTQTLSFFVRLKNRGCLRIKGADARPFLQNLVTNDVNLLSEGRAIYACLLTPQGKFLHDFFMIDSDGHVLIDCEGGERTLDLAKRLNMYKLRADVTIEAQENNTVYAVFDDEAYGVRDPRHNDIGYRSFEKPEGLEEKSFSQWDKRRIALTIPDGSRDLIVGSSTMDEAHMDQLGAISYDKGCYLGQELTARMHYRGLGKKHLQTVQLDALPEGAELRSSCEDIGIALVRGIAM